MGTVREHYYMYLQQTKFFNVVFIQGVWVKFKLNLNETGYGYKCNAKYNKCAHGENFSARLTIFDSYNRQNSF